MNGDNSKERNGLLFSGGGGNLPQIFSRREWFLFGEGAPDFILSKKNLFIKQRTME